MKKSMDGNTAAAHAAYAFSEVAAIYPITPSSGMGELTDAWAAEGRQNIFGKTVDVMEMQSEGGAAGAVHGALSAGALGTTFTASQGLLLMLPNMYKIAGELMPCVFHVAARAIAGQALSIFGDHQDVMAVRAAGFCMLSSNSVQEAMDMAAIAHLATLRASLPFLHFFDGFRTSHEIQKIEVLDYEELKKLVSWEGIWRHRNRALNPMHPYLKGSAQNPDIYFQENEAVNKYYLAAPKIVQEEMDRFAKAFGREYHLFDYCGHPQAESVIVMMGSGGETAERTVEQLVQKGDRAGLVKVRLYRPFDSESFMKALPASVKRIVILDRTKESGAFGEPLYLDVATVLHDRKSDIEVFGGRYGLGSKEFTPPQVEAVFENLKARNPKNHFTVGIEDDVTGLSLKVVYRGEECDDLVRCKFWGIGGDGTVGANKDAIKIIGDNTDLYVQGYFAYDSKKSSGITISHLRFGKRPIKAPYLIDCADYIACHLASYVYKYDILEGIQEGGIFVLNAPWQIEELEEKLPASLKKRIALNKVKFYMIDAHKLAREVGLKSYINMIMQTAFFKLSNIIPMEKAIALLKEAVIKTYRKKGQEIIDMNHKAIDQALALLQEVSYPASWAKIGEEPKKEDPSRPAFVRKVADVMNAQQGDLLPVSAFVPGGEFPMATTKYEKRDIAVRLPRWVSENCIQCNQCAFVCPHAVIRPVLLSEEEKKAAPEGMQVIKAVGKGLENMYYGIQISALDCTGCGNCQFVCPAPKGKALVMEDANKMRDKEKTEWEYSEKLPERDGNMSKFTVKGSQFQKPLLEFTGACAGCGETPYVKLLTQLFGARMIVANATGCSSIWGGSAPSVPWSVNSKGCGPAWANSLFEDNAEYGLGMVLSMDYRREELAHLVAEAQKQNIAQDLKDAFSAWLEKKDLGEESVALGEAIISLLQKYPQTELDEIRKRSDILIKPSIWIIGGDGWAYDIGYGGLDHVLAGNRNVNVLVLDTELYSNTGGQASKATPEGAIAKFAASGKKTQKKDLGRLAMTYGHIYVASVSLGADKQQVVRALKDAESYPGPSLVIAYASCISHGIKGGMYLSNEEEKKAVDSGYWLNYRYDPRLKAQNQNPLQVDSKDPSVALDDFLLGQARYAYLNTTHPEEAAKMRAALAKHQKEELESLKRSAEQK